ncbi:protein PET117 homolog, mitochondrial [Crotalus tigris]|uniref:protein PET117 homolog, mitochondrial n=1 Tax=Crotalus tigris TaxID=88082 RepID=UPI00192F4256|nr:protein PET117 homolog, mitochondrial [Crotalus tigris]
MLLAPYLQWCASFSCLLLWEVVELRCVMSAASKAALGVSVLLSGGAIIGVHIQQRRLREKLHEGVYRDLERQKYKEHFNILDKHTTLAIQLETENSKMLMARKS